MRILIVSVKSSDQVFSDFRKALKDVRSGKRRDTHLEVSFDNRKDFERFVVNLHVLQMIPKLKPTWMR
jgi:hypothetical protein